MDDNYCTNCKNNTQVVFDHSAGDAICLECGLVLESRSIDDTSDWRNLAGDTRDNYPNRVRSPVNQLLTTSDLATVTKQVRLGRNLSAMPRMLAGRGYDPDKMVITGFKTISTVADRPVVYKFGLNLENSIRLRLCKHKRKRGQ